MASVEMMVESLDQAKDTCGFTLDSLNTALKNADAVQAILILELIEKSVDLQARIARLLNAVKSED